MSYHYYIDCPQCGACINHAQAGCGSFDDMSPEELKEVEKIDKKIRESFLTKIFICEDCGCEHKVINYYSGKIEILKDIDNREKIRKKRHHEWSERAFASSEIDKIFDKHLSMQSKTEEIGMININKPVYVLKFKLDIIDFIDNCLHNKKKWNTDMKLYWKKLREKWEKKW